MKHVKIDRLALSHRVLADVLLQRCPTTTSLAKQSAHGCSGSRKRSADAAGAAGNRRGSSLKMAVDAPTYENRVSTGATITSA